MESWMAIILVVVILGAVVGITLYLKSASGKAPNKAILPKNETVKSRNASASPQSGSANIPLPSLPANKTEKTNNTYCIPKNTSYVWVGNGNFSTGTYYGWNTNGTGFGTGPLNLSNANYNGLYYGNPWRGYYGNFAATTYSQSHPILPGSISSNFVVVEPYLNFQITSPGSRDLYVEILYNGNPLIVNHYNTTSAPGANTLGTFTFASINLTGMICKSVTLRIVSNVSQTSSSQQNQFIAVGNFFMSSSPYYTYGVTVNGNVLGEGV